MNVQSNSREIENAKSERVPLRDLFPGLKEWIYCDTAARNPLNVLGKNAADRFLMQAYEGGNKNKMFETIERVRSLYADLINAKPEEIAITKNVSEGLNIIAHAMNWSSGDNIVVCPDVEHPNNVYVWYHAAKLYGLEVRAFRAEDYIVKADRAAELMDSRTRICAITAQSFVPGYLTNLEALGVACAKTGTALVVDGAQAAGVQDLDMEKLGVAAMATSAQKGLLGVYGLGFLYVRRHFAEVLQPRYLARFGVDIGDAHEADLGTLDSIRFANAATRFDLGNYNFLGAAAIEPGLQLLHSVGTRHISQHTRTLAIGLADQITSLGLPVLGWPKDTETGSIITIGSPSQDFAEKEQLASLSRFLTNNKVKFSERRGYLRFSFHIYNDEEDVQQVSELVSSWLSSGTRNTRP